MDPLPIDDVLPDIRAALACGRRLVLAAPPGAGKTTRVPVALLGEAWLGDGKILLLEPRRIAARLAAERMAATLGERVGARIGLSTRIERKVSGETRIEVITDGLFTRRILSDPALEGVGAVLFDEFHERSLNIDLGLALALDAQSALRPDLRLVAMSATLDTARLAEAISAPVVESSGRAHPVETIYLGRGAERIEDQMTRAIRRALREREGSILAFLPGMGEILRTAERLDDLPDEIIVAPLYGALGPAEQDRAVAPPPQGARKIVLATDIAESSLTIEGVAAVIDAGLARVAEYDPSHGGARLVTRRAARANVDQRRGRAGRTGPGACYRLWDEEATRGLPAAPTPEVLSANLSGLLLALAEWGERDAARLTWIDPPPAGRLAAAREELVALGALDEAGGLTARGKEIARLPLEPRLAAMIASAPSAEDRALAAGVAALIGERGLGGDSTDLRERLARLARDSSPRARALKNQAARWAGRASPAPASETGRIIANALPHLIARAKPGERGQFQLASGRAAQMDASAPLAGEKWLAVADLTGVASAARILAAAPLTEDQALAIGKAETADIAEFDAATRMLKARRVKRLGAIILSETPLKAPSGEAARNALIEALETHGLDLLEEARAIREWQARLSLARPLLPGVVSDWDDAALLQHADHWLAPLLGDPPDLGLPKAEAIARNLMALLDWPVRRALDEAAPETIETPAGRRLAIDYLAEGGPAIEARVQEFYGLAAHPAIMRGSLPLTISLLSPARRQVALTKDLPGFWKGGYRDMVKDMRGDYPKHDWPEDPANARAHEGKTKARLKREE